MTKHLQRLLLAILALTLLAGCAAPAASNTVAFSAPAATQPPSTEPAAAFSGEKGSFVALDSGEFKLDAKLFANNDAHYYHTRLANGKTVYLFVVKDAKGIYRAAANGCQVCYASRMGFRQEGDVMVCNTCGNRYPVNKIATEKGGCNPAPINSNLQIKDGQLVIKEAELAAIARYF